MDATTKRKPKPPPKPRFEAGDVVHTRRTVRVKLCSKLRPNGTTLTKYLALVRGAEWVVLSSFVPDGKRAVRYRLRCKPYEVERPESALLGTGRRVEA